jgi:hypothetical protein
MMTKPVYDSEEYAALHSRIGREFGHDMDKAIDRVMVLEDDLTTARATCARLQRDMQFFELVANQRGDFLSQIRQQMQHGDVMTFDELPKAITQQAAQVTTLTAALRRYGQHDYRCPATRMRDFCRQHGGDGSINGCPACQNIPRTGDCTCGLDAAVLRAASEGA